MTHTMHSTHSRRRQALLGLGLPFLAGALLLHPTPANSQTLIQANLRISTYNVVQGEKRPGPCFGPSESEGELPCGFIAVDEASPCVGNKKDGWDCTHPIRIDRWPYKTIEDSPYSVPLKVAIKANVPGASSYLVSAHGTVFGDFKGDLKYDWTCVQGQPITCTAQVPNFDHAVLAVRYKLFPGSLACSLTSVIEIVDAPPGSSWNYDPTDDRAEASFKLGCPPTMQAAPAVLLPPQPAPRTEQASPPTHRTAPTPPPGAIPPPPQVTRNTPILPQQPTCGRGQMASNGRCCPVGSDWTGRQCEKKIAATCGRGMTGTPPNCRTILEVKPVLRTCPQGQIGTPPNCRTTVLRYLPRPKV
jgi:hypothetical protein